MAELKNIILDLGGVLLNIDYDKTEKAFNELGFEQFKKMYSQYSADAVFAEKEKPGRYRNRPPRSRYRFRPRWEEFLNPFSRES